MSPSADAYCGDTLPEPLRKVGLLWKISLQIRCAFDSERRGHGSGGDLLSAGLQHVSRTNQHFVHMFTSPDPLHSPYALQEGVAALITNHFLINNRSIVRYQLQHPDQMTLYLGYRNDERGEVKVNASQWISSFNQKKHMEYLEGLFPLLFDPDNLPLLRDITAYQRMDEVGYFCQESHCNGCIYHWELVTTFDGRAAGDFMTLLDAKTTDCQGNEWQLMHYLSVFLCFLAAVSLGLICRKIRRSIKVINQFRASSETWAMLTCQDLASMMSIWWAVTVLSNILQLVAAVFCLRPQPEIGTRFTWVGFSCFCTWLNMIQYFESFPSYFIAFHTISRGGTRILQLFFSVAPFFFAFILLGVCLFWKSAMFSSPESAAEMLFSLMNGDSIHDAFKEVRSVGGILLQAYLYVFIFLAIYVILNINIGIVEDAFHEAKHRYVRHHDGPPEGESNDFSERVRRAIEEESPELDFVELLNGRHVGAGSETQLPLPPAQPGTTTSRSTARSSEIQGTISGNLMKTMSGKYISPRYLESPNLQEALGDAFFDRGRSASLPVRNYDRSSLLRPPRGTGTGGTGIAPATSGGSSSSESQRGMDQEEVPTAAGSPEMEMRVVDQVQEALEEIYTGAAHLRNRMPHASGQLLSALNDLDQHISQVENLVKNRFKS